MSLSSLEATLSQVISSLLTYIVDQWQSTDLIRHRTFNKCRALREFGSKRKEITYQCENQQIWFSLLHRSTDRQSESQLHTEKNQASLFQNNWLQVELEVHLVDILLDVQREVYASEQYELGFEAYWGKRLVWIEVQKDNQKEEFKEGACEIKRKWKG